MDRPSVIKLSIVNNRLSNQSRDSEPSRVAGDVVFFFRMYGGPTFHWDSRAVGFGQYFREYPTRFTEIKFATLSEKSMLWM